MGPTSGHDNPSDQLEYSPNDDMDVPLLRAREAHPELDIYHLSIGYLAVPGGTPVFVASTVDGLLGKLRHG